MHKAFGVAERVKMVARDAIITYALCLTMAFAIAFASINAIRSLRDESSISRTQITGLHADFMGIRSNIGNIRRFEKDVLLNVGDTPTQLRYIEQWNALISDALDRTKHFQSLPIFAQQFTFKADADADAIGRAIDEYHGAVEPVLLKLTYQTSITPQRGNELIEPAKKSVRTLDKVLQSQADAILAFEKRSTNFSHQSASTTIMHIALITVSLAILLLAAAIRHVRRSRQTIGQLADAAIMDRVTKLYSLEGFRHHAAVFLKQQNPAAAAGEQTTNTVMLCINVDHFRLINSSYGNLTGDWALKRIAGVLQGISQLHCLARIGSDEFTAIAVCEDQANVDALADLVLQQIRCCQLTILGKRHHVTASVGIASFDINVTNIDTALSLSDAACFTAKQQGGDRYDRIQSGEQALPDIRTDMHNAVRLHELIDQDALILFRQDILCVKDHSKRCELLIRGCDPITGNVIGAADIIPAAEKFGMAILIDNWVLETVFKYLETGRLEGYERVAINLSARSVTNPDFFQSFERVLVKNTKFANRLCIEITETALVENHECTRDFMNIGQAHGVLFAIDDFGSGTTSFELLRSLPFDILKVDGQFVRKMAEHETDRAIVKGFVEVAKTLNMLTVAECAETNQDILILRGIDVDYIQGFAHHKPEPVSSFSSPMLLQATGT